MSDYEDQFCSENFASRQNLIIYYTFLSHSVSVIRYIKKIKNIFYLNIFIENKRNIYYQTKQLISNNWLI